MRFLPSYYNRGCENFCGRVHLLGVLLHFYLQVLLKITEGGYTIRILGKDFGQRFRARIKGKDFGQRF